MIEMSQRTLSLSEAEGKNLRIVSEELGSAHQLNCFHIGACSFSRRLEYHSAIRTL